MHIPKLSTSASALLLCSAAQANRFLKTPLNDPRVPSFSRTREQQQVLMKREGSVPVGVDPHDWKHTVNVTIGTPPQNLRLLIAPGLGDTIIPFWSDNLCNPNPNTCGKFGIFNSSMSSTFENVSNTLMLEQREPFEYTQQHFKDSLSIEGAFMKGLEMIVLPQFESDNTYQEHDMLGVLGLGLLTSEVEAGSNGPYPNFLEEMVRQNVSQTRAYSIWLNDSAYSGGELAFGSIDTAKFTGDMVVVPAMVSREDSAPAVPLFSLSYCPQGGASAWAVTPSTPLLAILDTNEDGIILPSTIFEQIGFQMNVDLSTDVNCSLVPKGAWSSFSLGNGYGPVIIASLSSLLLHTGLPNDDLCYWNIDSWDIDYAILGAPFLRSAYAVYNWEANEIALAQASPSPNASNIIPITGPQIPGAVVVSSNGTYSCPAPIEGHPLPALCRSSKEAMPIADNQPPVPSIFPPVFVNSSPEAKRHIILMILTTVCVIVFLTPFLLLNAALFWGGISSGLFHLWNMASGVEESPN